MAARPALTIFLLAFAVRAIAAMTIAVLHHSVLFHDDALYASMTREAALGRTAEWDQFTRRIYGDTIAFTGPVTLAKALTGGLALTGQLLAAAAGAATAAATTWLSARVVQLRWALAAGAYVALLPSQVLWSSLTLKDPFAWAAGAAFAVSLFKIIRQRGRPQLLYGVAAVTLLFVLDRLRFHTFVIAGWAAFIALAAIPHRHRLGHALAAACLALGLPLALGLGPGGYGLVNARELSHWRALNAIDAETAVVAPVLTAASASQQVAVAESKAATVEAQVVHLEARASDLEAAAHAQSGTSGPSTTAASSTGSSTTGSSITTSRPVSSTVSTGVASTDELLKEAKALRVEADRLRSQAAAQLQRVADLRGKQAETETRAEPVIDSAFGSSDRLPSGLSENLRYLPRGVAVVLFWPYPWQATSNAAVRVARLENLVWYPVLLVGLIGLGQVLRHRAVLLVPLLLAGGLGLASALTEGNFGTAYRHRGEFVWVAAILAAVGADALDRRFRERRLAR
jgi:hypothetical protein